MTEANNTRDTASTGRIRGMKRVVGGVVLALATGVGLTAWAAAPGGHHGPAHGGFGPAGFGMGFAGDPARLDRMVDRVLGGVNATEAQRTQVKQIVQAAATDLKAQRESGRGLREQSAQLFTAPTVDAGAVESLRQKMLAQHDASSQRISQALVEISRVLTPEQRVQLAEQMKKRGEHRRERGHDKAHEKAHEKGHGPRGEGGARSPEPARAPALS